MAQARIANKMMAVPGYKVFGKHIYGNLYECEGSLLSDPEYLERVVRESAKIGNMTLLDIRLWRIEPGVSIVGIVLESHITIHTWPEHNFATVDVYSCGEHTNPEAAFKYIVKALKAKRFEYEIADRSYIE